jgi:hypothetical protein
MGTNYYLRSGICEKCGRSDEERHIGKSSGGWCFSLHIDPTEGINNLGDWRKLFTEPGNVIFDEYGTQQTPAEMIDTITNRGRDAAIIEKTPYGYDSWNEFHRQNGSEFGPRGMLRHKIGSHCTGHGEGTWDLITGEFC